MPSIIETREEHVTLVDDNNAKIGACLKSTVHGSTTPLHRGFSVFLFDADFRLLVQQRALHKITWPGIWSNSCCGHPAPDENPMTAALRRLKEELCLSGGELYEALPYFRYRSRYLGVEENEFCPVFVGRVDAVISGEPSEINAIDWIEWHEFLLLTESHPTTRWGQLSPWSVEEAAQLSQMTPSLESILCTLKPFNPWTHSL